MSLSQQIAYSVESGIWREADAHLWEKALLIRREILSEGRAGVTAEALAQLTEVLDRLPAKLDAAPAAPPAG
jgi:hypothetical protein